MKTYVIAYTSRVGSTWLCDLLKSSGLVGAAGEYLNVSDPDERKAAFDRIGEIIESHSVNGIGGIKVASRFAGRFLSEDTTWIHLQRRDKVGQAISMVRSRGANRWHVRGKQKPIPWPDYDRDDINGRLKAIDEATAHWRKFFRVNKITPLEVWYEDLMEDQDREVRRCLEAIGVERPGALDLKTNLHILRDDTTELWRQRYLEGK